jgi:hypothetical protein
MRQRGGDRELPQTVARLWPGFNDVGWLILAVAALGVTVATLAFLVRAGRAVRRAAGAAEEPGVERMTGART